MSEANTDPGNGPVEDGPETAARWLRFWSADAWRRWWSLRAPWRAYTSDKRRLTGEISRIHAELASTRDELTRVRRQLAWAADMRPGYQPIRTARAETGLAAVTGVTLLEIRKRDGREVWTPVDQGTVYFTNRKFVFSGRKDIEFRFDRLTDIRGTDQGLHAVTSTRKRAHVLAGPVDQLATLVAAGQAVAAGLPATAPFDTKAEAQGESIGRLERRSAELVRTRDSLARPDRPISPGWAPATLVTLFVILGSGGWSAAETPAGRDVAVEATTTTTESKVRALPVTTSTAAPATTTTAGRPATTTPEEPAMPGAEVLLAAPAAGPSGDPGSAIPETAEAVTVSSITDGDTLEVRHGDGTPGEVRLIGMNSPEVGECFADEAAQVLAVLVPVGSEIGMTSDVSDTDQYGRLLRYLWVGEMSVNEETVRRGAAIARRYPPDTALSDRLEAAQQAARAGELGLWAPHACGPAADATVKIIDLRFDAPGDDNVNLDEEWVRVRNDGTEPVDLTGWGIKDESASHRYEFPRSFTLAPGETATVHTGCGDDFGARLHWCSVGSAVWNNDGDTAFLLDPSGNTHATYGYQGVATTTTTLAPTTTATEALTTTTQPVATASPEPASSGCDPSYPDVCIPPGPPDLNCGDVPDRRFSVVGSDPHGFDGDNDGIGCES